MGPMRRFALAALLVLSTYATDAVAAAPDRLTQMFQWWNQAFRTPGGFSEDAFRKYFTDDAKLVIDGHVSADGVAAWARHFQRIQAGGGEVEIVVPFKTVFQSGDRIYTQHVIRSRRDGNSACLLAAGHAVLRNDKIALVNLVRTRLEPGSDAFDASCWR
ncbi:MAG: hypothetical protein JWM77_3731 [Rhodospirillales bacterium]|nr:hypothetical protein [Rhodospirillales bacterium]